MEKFGIFELLDALAALSENASEPRPSEQTQRPQPQTQQPQPPQQDMRVAAIDGFYARHDAISKRVKR